MNTTNSTAKNISRPRKNRRERVVDQHAGENLVPHDLAVIDERFRLRPGSGTPQSDERAGQARRKTRRSARARGTRAAAASARSSRRAPAPCESRAGCSVDGVVRAANRRVRVIYDVVIWLRLHLMSPSMSAGNVVERGALGVAIGRCASASIGDGSTSCVHSARSSTVLIHARRHVAENRLADRRRTGSQTPTAARAIASSRGVIGVR